MMRLTQNAKRANAFRSAKSHGNQQWGKYRDGFSSEVATYLLKEIISGSRCHSLDAQTVRG